MKPGSTGHEHRERKLRDMAELHCRARRLTAVSIWLRRFVRLARPGIYVQEKGPELCDVVVGATKPSRATRGAAAIALGFLETRASMINGHATLIIVLLDLPQLIDRVREDVQRWTVR
jgi:hypothetical protein